MPPRARKPSISWTADLAQYLVAASSASDAHSGGRYLWAEEGNNGITYLNAPDSYRGNKLFFSGGELSYWTRWSECVQNRDWGFGEPFRFCSGTGSPLNPEDWPGVSIESATSPKILVFQAGPADFAEDQWVRRSIAFAPDASVRVYNPTAGETLADATQASQKDIDDVLSDISKFRIRGEHRGGAWDSVLLDDVRWSHALEGGG